MAVRRRIYIRTRTELLYYASGNESETIAAKANKLEKCFRRCIIILPPSLSPTPPPISYKKEKQTDATNGVEIFPSEILLQFGLRAVPYYITII